MAFQITIQPSGHTCSAEAGTPILRAVLDAGLMLPYGCRNGACGACKGKLISGSVDYGCAEPSALSEQERAAGLALFCCAMPLSDLVIESRELAADSDIPVRTMPARVQKMERLAPDVMALSLKLPANERLLFLAGQYIEILLKDGRRRAFSLANAPHDDELLQIHVRQVPGGMFTGQVFGAMKERDILRFEGPHGDFYLREGSDKPVILLAGGTGFAPIKAIVEHVLHQRMERSMTLYWGAREPAGLYLPELPQRWAAEHENLRYVPVVETPDPNWRGRCGLVHRAVLEDYPDLSDHQVYACGAPLMIDAARRDFVARGLPEEEFFADAFSFAATGS
ncbi:CDP-6-deoxy-L-threo-D-glycero-4-hexulose-3-dehydrase reductase [mine drainage metagenome]|uniref:CDP-6-deoxy-L-threo-D-glycero-4-hexulose-3-dehydrase reductase n=1 Tax=mine drainage metagenome TaxID=410659 RepID=A0A1J5R964_9ZZZZ